MANQNPIHVNEEEVLTTFEISAADQAKQVCITIDADLNDVKWKLQTDTQVFLETEDLYTPSSPLPENLGVGVARDIAGKRLLIQTALVLVSTVGGVTGNLPVYNYTLTFTAGGLELAKFSAKSSDKNTTQFNSLSKFSLV